MSLTSIDGPVRLDTPDKASDPAMRFTSSVLPFRMRASAMASSTARHAAANRSALIRSCLFGALANLLVAGSALYARPLQDALWTDAGDGGLLLLVAIALGLFALHALLDFARIRELARLAPAGGASAWLDRIWVPDAAWAPVHIAVLALLHPLPGALALAGVAAAAAMIAVGATGAPASLAHGPAFDRQGGTGSFGCADSFLAGLRFCETVYQVLVVGLAAALLLRGTLQPSQFVAASLIGVAAMRAATQAAVSWHRGRQVTAGLMPAADAL